MANNRMYLVHKPSGLKFYLGKRMGWGWYCKPEEDLTGKLQKFFDECIENNGDEINSQDDFAIGMEDPLNDCMIQI